MRQLRWLLVALAAIGCGLPKNVVRPPSSALLDTRHTTLGELIAPAVAKHPGESGFLLFNTGEGGIQARVAMADVAQSSIDAQYFMWGRDTVGRVLLDRLIAAADRGVRVRLLIDDYWASGQDPAFQAIDAHPNIEVRVFNPFSRGRMRITQLLGRFTELNRRMHNKLFVADGQVAVVGGRNLIDEYFGLGKEICYRDFDLLAIGPVAAEAEAGFDRYWNSQWTYPISSLVKPASQAERDRGARPLLRAGGGRSRHLPLRTAARPGRRAGLAGAVPRQGGLGPGRAGLRRSKQRGEPGRRAARHGLEQDGLPGQPCRARARPRERLPAAETEDARSPRVARARRAAPHAHQLARHHGRGPGQRALRQLAPGVGRSGRGALRDEARRRLARAVHRAPGHLQGAPGAARQRRRCSTARRCSSDRSTSTRAR